MILKILEIIIRDINLSQILDNCYDFKSKELVYLIVNFPFSLYNLAYVP